MPGFDELVGGHQQRARVWAKGGTIVARAEENVRKTGLQVGRAGVNGAVEVGFGGHGEG